MSHPLDRDNFFKPNKSRPVSPCGMEKIESSNFDLIITLFGNVDTKTVLSRVQCSIGIVLGQYHTLK